jgi:hypothetical protein
MTAAFDHDVLADVLAHFFSALELGLSGSSESLSRDVLS